MARKEAIITMPEKKKIDKNKNKLSAKALLKEAEEQDSILQQMELTAQNQDNEQNQGSSNNQNSSEKQSSSVKKKKGKDKYPGIPERFLKGEYTAFKLPESLLHFIKKKTVDERSTITAFFIEASYYYMKEKGWVKPDEK